MISNSAAAWSLQCTTQDVHIHHSINIVSFHSHTPQYFGWDSLVCTDQADINQIDIFQPCRAVTAVHKPKWIWSILSFFMLMNILILYIFLNILAFVFWDKHFPTLQQEGHCSAQLEMYPIDIGRLADDHSADAASSFRCGLDWLWGWWKSVWGHNQGERIFSFPALSSSWKCEFPFCLISQVHVKRRWKLLAALVALHLLPLWVSEWVSES